MSLSIIFRYIARDVYNYEKPIEQYEDFHSFHTSDLPTKVCKNFKTRLDYRLSQLQKSYNIRVDFRYLPNKVLLNNELVSTQCYLRYYITFVYKSHTELVTLTISAFRIGGSTLVSFYYE